MKNQTNSPSPKQRLASRLKELRTIRGWSQRIAANAIGIKLPTYSAYEEQRGFPSLRILAKMGEAFRCSIDYLMKRETI